MPGSDRLPPIRGKTAFLPANLSGFLPDQIGIETLAELFLCGVRRILAEPSASEAGQQVAANALNNRISRLNALLGSRGLAQVALKVADRNEVKAWRRALTANELAGGDLADDTIDEGRRGLLSRLTAPATESIAPDLPTVSALSRLQSLEADRPGALFAHVAVIRADLCNGCDACVTICPQDALILNKDNPDRHCNTLRAQDCDGCGLCLEICEPDAIELIEMAEQPDGILLDAFECRGCGVEVHEPAGQGAGDRLCRICRKTDPRRLLHQVLT